jgi:hypothetical protein
MIVFGHDNYVYNCEASHERFLSAKLFEIVVPTTMLYIKMMKEECEISIDLGRVQSICLSLRRPVKVSNHDKPRAVAPWTINWLACHQSRETLGTRQRIRYCTKYKVYARPTLKKSNQSIMPPPYATARETQLRDGHTRACFSGHHWPLAYNHAFFINKTKKSSVSYRHRLKGLPNST